MYKQITPTILGVGVTDTDLDLFENQYPLTDGVTYNSYVVTAGEGGVTAVIDSVDRRRTASWMERLQAAAPLGVDYLIVQHMEPDHSASIADFMAAYPGAKIVCSAQTLKMLSQFFPSVKFEGRTMVVGEGTTIEIGDHKLTFLAAPMVHWPEVIVTYDSTTGTLFSADAFGTFGTSDEPSELWPDEARRYYTNIVGKYGPQVQRLLAKAGALEGLTRVCPLHGPILEGEHIANAVKLYNLWSTYTPELPEGVLVAYASIYGHTAAAARDLATKLEERGAEVATIDLCRQDVSYAVGQAFRMGRIVLASPTYDAGIFPAMHSFIYHLQIKGLRNRTFGLIENGSWAPAAARGMAAMLAEVKDATILPSTVTIRSAADSTTDSHLDALAAALLA